MALVAAQLLVSPVGQPCWSALWARLVRPAPAPAAAPASVHPSVLAKEGRSDVNQGGCDFMLMPAMVLCLKPLPSGLSRSRLLFPSFLIRLSLDQTSRQSDARFKCRQDLLPSRRP